VVVGADGTLFLLALEDGRKLWSYKVSDAITSPAVYGDLVIVGSDEGTVVAFR
jgi:outer membrane protein assembly factor BamB